MAVDAALAYDESAKLLKGTGWKMNFKTPEGYKAAKGDGTTKQQSSSRRKRTRHNHISRSIITATKLTTMAGEEKAILWQAIRRGRGAKRQNKRWQVAAQCRGIVLPPTKIRKEFTTMLSHIAHPFAQYANNSRFFLYIIT